MSQQPFSSDNGFSTTGNVVAGYVLILGNISPSAISSPAPSLNGFDSVNAINLSASGNVTGANFVGNGSQLTGVTATANTGNVTFNDQIVIGTGISNLVSGLYLSPSSSSANAVQYLRVRGDVSYEPTHIHFDTGNNQYFNQFIGDDNKYVLLSNSGNIVVNTDDYVGNSAQWTFGTNGNLSLPRGGIVYETNIPFGGFDGNTIALKPSGGTNADQQLLVYPTANTIDANHLHLTSGNLYNTELFLGSDDLYVKLANTGNVIINSNNGNGNVGTWTFGADGTTTFPTNLSINYSGNDVQFPRIIADSGKAFSIQGQGNTGSAALAWTVDPDAAGQYATVGVTKNGGDNLAKVILTAQSNSGDVASVKAWQFDETGNLTFPSGNLVINSDSTTFSNAAVISSADHNLITLSTGVNGGLSSVWVEDYANIGTSNIAAVYANPTPGSKIVRIVVGQNGGNAGPNLWDFDGTGNLTAPGNISATGNITAPYFIGNGSQLTGVTASASNSIANGSSSVSIPTNNGQVIINPYDVNGTYNWRFSAGGSLYLPNQATMVANSGGMTFTTNDTPTAQKITLNDTVGFTPGNIVLSTNGGNYAWTLDQTGSLTAPGNISTTGNISSGNINVGGAGNALSQVTIYGNANASLGMYNSNVDVGAQIYLGDRNFNTSALWNSAPGIGATYDTNYGGLAGALGLYTYTGNTNSRTLRVTVTAAQGQVFIHSIANSDGTNSGALQVAGGVGVAGNVNVGGYISATGNIYGGNIIGNGSQLTNVAQQTTGSWTLAAGTNTVSFTVQAGAQYTMWVNGNIPNGIVLWNATVSLSNTNVPAVGTQYGWYYVAGNALVLTSMPTQIVGTAGGISTATVVTTTSNVFTFDITNNSGTSQTINYGYTKL